MEKTRIPNNQKIILLGCGAVGKCVLYYLKDFFDYTEENVYVIEKNKKEKEFPTVKQSINNGIHFINFEIKNENLDYLFLHILNVKEYDIIIDLTTRTNTFEIFKKVREYSLLYINTSIEDNRKKDNYIDKSIFSQHVNLKHIDEKLKYKKTTTLIEYGMNPGLISTFVKYGLKKLSKKVIEYQIDKKCLDKELYDAFLSDKYNLLSKRLNIKTIHCSEIDTQVPNTLSHSSKDALVNTWSCLGLIDEGCDPLEITLGTHERLPKIIKALNIKQQNKNTFTNYYSQQLIVNKPGCFVKTKSFAPIELKGNNIKFTNFEGRCIHHGESISLNRFLSDEMYSPTIHYVYQLNPITSNYIDTHSKDELIFVSKTENWEVMNMYNNELKGYDNIGALFILETNPFNNKKENYLYWTGSILNTDYTKNILKDNYFGPTVIQVMAGILSGLSYIVKNKNLGLIFGEDLPEDYVIEKCKKYLGYFYSGCVNNNIESIYFDELLI